MPRTLEAIIEPDEPAEVTGLLSEPALAADWNRPEEDAAWQHLQAAE
ncbi:MAG TPA: hypothetical protein VGB15_00350 [Longimicrobium sp.]|jgi:hypothetical protein